MLVADRNVSGAAGLHGAVPVVLDGLDLDLSATHDEWQCQTSLRIGRREVDWAAMAWLVVEGRRGQRRRLACAASG